MQHGLVYLLVLLFMASCQKFETQSQVPVRKKIETDVIYGVDDRVDYFEVEDSHWQELTLSTVALIDHKRIEKSNKPGFMELQGPVFGHSFHLCTDEPFLF